MQRTKRLRVFGGPNGSGKSTVYQDVKIFFSEIPFINADEIETLISKKKLIDLDHYKLNLKPADWTKFLKRKESRSLIEKAKQSGHTINLVLRENCIVTESSETQSYEASLIASFIRWALYKKGNSFAFETVMSHEGKLQELKDARKNGFKIYLYFVCIDDPLINIERVKDRVKKGGHNVNSEKLQSRYLNTLKNLHKAIKLSDKVFLFDNSEKIPQFIAEISSERLIINTDSLPDWFIQFVLPYYNK